MSKEAARKFLEMMESNPQLRSSLQKAAEPADKRKILHQNNLHFTKAEYMQACKEKYHRELTENELKQIAAAGTQRITAKDAGHNLNAHLWAVQDD